MVAPVMTEAKPRNKKSCAVRVPAKIKALKKQANAKKQGHKSGNAFSKAYRMAKK